MEILLWTGFRFTKMNFFFFLHSHYTSLQGCCVGLLKLSFCILRLCLFGEMFHLNRFCLVSPRPCCPYYPFPSSAIPKIPAAPSPFLSWFCWGLSLCHPAWMDDLAQRFRDLYHHLLLPPGLSARLAGSKSPGLLVSWVGFLQEREAPRYLGNILTTDSIIESLNQNGTAERANTLFAIFGPASPRNTRDNGGLTSHSLLGRTSNHTTR